MIPLTATEVERVLKKNGFVHTRAVGSHFQWINVDRHSNVTVPLLFLSRWLGVIVMQGQALVIRFG